ncbi:MAG: hypothetical protein JJE21_10165, partial [Spirochaetaceae bacterium]|nr:hypothetical protein [Spirochaetaceae bacterium]
MPKKESGFSHIPGPKEWEKQMIDLSLTHHNVIRKRYSFVLADRNKVVQKKLNRIRNTISGISSEIISLIPAARWLFENYQIMYREIEKENMSDTSYDKLPILRTKQYRGYPRVYLVAKNMVAISRGHINEKNISIMINAYQKETPLTDEELGILPIILGFSLLEQIIEVADDIIRIIKIKSKADRFVKEKISAHHSETDISALLCELDADCKNNYSFHSQVIYLLRNMSFSKVAILKYTDYHYSMDNKYRQPANIFSEEGKLESYLESNIQVLIGSLRAINELDYEQFFEELSYIDSILANDPAEVYSKMDSNSRSMYRSIIIKMSKKYNVKEEIIAYDCLKLATRGRKDLANSTHVGYYLLGKGYQLLKNEIRNKKQPDNLEKRKYKNLDNKGNGILYYLVIFSIFVMICFGMSFLMNSIGTITERYLYVLFIIVGFPLLLGISSNLTNYMFTKGIKNRQIPSLDYKNGIPDVARTFLIMPVLISSLSQCKDYLERLERHYLNNRQSNLYFALVIDFEDSLQKHIPKDDILEEFLVKQIEKYNIRYPSINQKFCLFIRER